MVEKIWIRKNEKGRIIITTSIEEIKPYIYVVPQEDDWIEINLKHEENGKDNIT